MIHRFYIVPCIIVLACILVGCGSVSSVSKSIAGKQEWSENYASIKGVEATAPQMVDGDMSTVGETETPSGKNARGVTEFTEAIVKLPEKKAIRRIVVYTPNMENFTIYAAGEGEDNWTPLQELKNNKENKVDVSVSAVTDQVRIRVRKTSDDEIVPGGRSRKQMRRAKGKIQEIEIYGLVQAVKAKTAQATTGQAVVSSTSSTPGTSVTPGTPNVPAAPAPVASSTSPAVTGKIAEVPKPPSINMSLESPNNTYKLAGPIPIKMNIKVGPVDLVVLADNVSDEMLRTKLLVKTAEGVVIPCSKPTPKLSFPKPYRGTGREVSVRNAKTLDADSVITVNIPNLLEYYPIDKPGNYTVQFDTKLEVHDNFLGSAQTQIEDIERTIRDVNSRANYSATEKASIIQGLREEIAGLEKSKGNRYIQVGAKGNPLDFVSNVLEFVIQ